jgi:hypothetical protein
LDGGLGKPFATLTAAEKHYFWILAIPTWITYATTVTLTRLSIIYLYRRVFDVKRFRTATTIAIIICVLWYIAEGFVAILQCQPIAGAWNKSIPAQCLGFRTHFVGVGTSNLLLDIIVLALPLKQLWCIILPIRQKFMLSGIILLGAFVCIASLGRIVTAQQIEETDITYTLLTPYTFSALEVAFAIICACLPTYRPLFPKSFSWGSIKEIYSNIRKRSFGAISWTGRHSNKNKTNNAEIQDSISPKQSIYELPTMPRTPQIRMSRIYEIDSKNIQADKPLPPTPAHFSVGSIGNCAPLILKNVESLENGREQQRTPGRAGTRKSSVQSYIGRYMNRVLYEVRTL